jgi:histone-lysine N-methyltransferase SETD1
MVQVCKPPGSTRPRDSAAHQADKRRKDEPLTKDELMQAAEYMFVKELGKVLQKDIMEQIVSPKVRRLAMDEKARRAPSGVKVNGIVKVNEPKDGEKEKKGFKGLSFKRKKPATVVEHVVKVVKPAIEDKMDVDEMAATEVRKRKVAEELADEDEEAKMPPKKKTKKETPKKARKIVIEDELESEDDQQTLTIPEPEPTLPELELVSSKKRPASVEPEDEAEYEPVKKKAKTTKAAKVPKPAAAKKKTSKKKDDVEEAVFEQVLPEELPFEEPFVASVHVTPEKDSSLSPAISPLTPAASSPTIAITESIALAISGFSPINPRVLGVCENEEDEFFASQYLAKETPSSPLVETAENVLDMGASRKHLTGSARTEGFYKISHAEKQAYVDQYAHRAIAADPSSTKGTKSAAPGAVNSSRANRSNARHIGKGLEEMNQLLQQKRTGSAKDGPNADLTIKFNQLQTRKKHLRFARSPIHDWGLYAMEKISRGEMVIEYVGEVVRAAVADKREKAYERQGIGSSYLFRIDDDLVVDATKKGNLGYVVMLFIGCTDLTGYIRRLINHSCDPNCTAKIITISNVKKIVIYAKQDIELGDEITYGAQPLQLRAGLCLTSASSTDYHFPIEQDNKIPCLCGSTKCRKYLN